ncbi:hypothetical protein K504DRAFT_508148 [Pleomassaria siparia CBS 279.74]|uniref:Uncharacterized protein n=1 Tax=Pleomassaria siparia CBS 279.74 TaxID=1314801 RepID=A0A6G1JSH5_9PLEO|nr:hypothetical protein K504DRAFT_508148 [Pleomassaria siparia CBS 279.74]
MSALFLAAFVAPSPAILSPSKVTSTHVSIKVIDNAPPAPIDEFGSPSKCQTPEAIIFDNCDPRFNVGGLS